MIYTEIEDRALEAIGSKAIYRRGRAKALLKNKEAFRKASRLPSKPYQRIILDRLKVGDSVLLDRDMRRFEGYTFSKLISESCKSDAAKAIGECGQKSNYFTGSPKIFGDPYQKRWELIHYKGRFKGRTGHTLYQDYQSCVGRSRSGRSAIVIQRCKLVRRLIAPSGMRFTHDSNGLFLQRQSDKMDFHVNESILLAKDFATQIRRGMAKNYAARMAQRKAAKIAAKDQAESARVEKIKAREIATVRVTLEDSRRAGNCVEGSLAYCELKLSIPRQEIIDNGYLFSVPAGRLLKVNGEPGVVRAVNCAWLRETTVAI